MKKFSTDFLMQRLKDALKELQKLSYDFASNIPKSEPIFVQETMDQDSWWQIEMVYLEAWSDENEEYLMFAVDIRDGYVRLGSIIIYSKHGNPEVRVDEEVHFIHP